MVDIMGLDIMGLDILGIIRVSTSWCESLRSSLSGVCKVLVLYLYIGNFVVN